MTSIQQRLIVGVFALVTLTLGVGGLAVYQRVEVRLYDDFDRRLLQRARALVSMIEMEVGWVEVDWLEFDEDPPGHEEHVDYYSLWFADGGEALVRDEEQGAWELPRFGSSAAVPIYREIELPGGRDGRAVGLKWALRPEADEDPDEDESLDSAVGFALPQPLIDSGGTQAEMQLVVAKVDEAGATLAVLRGQLLMLWAGCGLLAGLLAWLAIARGLSPLRRLSSDIGQLNEQESGQRIPSTDLPNELQPVAQALNALLERVEQALIRERTLTSNVAHELRTPVAGILSILEVTLGRLRSSEEYRASSQECLEIAKRMHWLVSNLLSVTRIEAGNVRLQTREICLSEYLREWWEPFQSTADEKGLVLDWQVDPNVVIETDPEFLRVVVSNLFDNAVAYTPAERSIRVEVSSEGGVAIANQALNLDAKIVDRVFDPFWREDESRDQVGIHVGLGLNLCHKIVTMLGGTISAEVKEYDELFEVRLERL